MPQMAFRGIRLSKLIRTTNIIVCNKLYSTSSIVSINNLHHNNLKQPRSKQNLKYLEDPDSFGTLSRVNVQNDILEDEGDLKEEQYLTESPLPTQKLSTKQYADIIKQYLKHKRLKEAINVLEVRMLKEDRVKPENYIYNILIGACADVGFTKKAFKLFNDMKRRSLKPSGDTYTCLFQACVNSPWPSDGLQHAKHLRELMIEKGVEPNLTNYNAMIKAFGRCGDLLSAFQIVDEMVAKKIKIRVHTFNHLLHACISDKENGLRHALFVWRKMLKLREKPNIYSFNLMLKCVKDCNLGSKENIAELIHLIQEQSMLGKTKSRLLLMQNTSGVENNEIKNELLTENSDLAETMNECKPGNVDITSADDCYKDHNQIIQSLEPIKELNLEKKDNVYFEFVNAKQESKNDRSVPNLLSKVLNMQHVLTLQEVHSVKDKFAVVGGQEDFLKEMEQYCVKPDIKTFTQMLPLLEETTEAENKLLETMRSLNIKADIDFFNMLIKSRCFRSDYKAAFEVKELIEKENKLRKKHHPLKKKHILKVNILTYGLLALACETKQTAEKLLEEMKEKQLKANITILGTLLKQGIVRKNFDYVLYILNVVKEENIQVDDIFLKNLERFNETCKSIVEQKRNNTQTHGDFIKSYKLFLHNYNTLLKNVNIEETLKPEHPWQQFNDTYPETVQRQPFVIDEPKRFYKRNRKYVRYAPKQ